MTPDLPAVEIAIVEMTNAFRQSHKFSALRRNPLLDKVARNYAQYLARSGKFSHSADGRQVADRARDGGYRYCWVGENLASRLDSRGFQTRQLALSSIEGWKNSPGHRRNMLQGLATEIGVGVARAPGQHKYLSVQVLGRPEALRFSFKVRNETAHALRYTYRGKAQNLPPSMVIKHTVCEPGALVFGDDRRSGKPGLTFQYTTRAGDLFALRPAEKDRFRVVHIPRTN